MFHLPLVEDAVALILAVLGAAGLAGLAGLMAVESFGLPPLPGEVILLFAGFLVADGAYSFAAAFLTALLGSLAGSLLAYWAGRDARGWIFPVGRAPRLPVDPQDVERLDGWFRRHGDGTVAFARLVPVVRSYVSYPAGAARMPVPKFTLFTAAGAAPFTLVLLYAGVRLGAAWNSLLPYFDYLDDAAVAAIVLIAAVLAVEWARRRSGRSRAPSAHPGAEPPA